MSTHATAEELSAYLDHELPEPETQEIKEHLADCESCHERLEGMRRVVLSLKGLEPMAPSPTLDLLVARRVKLEREQMSLSDRIESRLGGFQRQSSFLVLFAVVIALAAILLMFSQALHKSSHLPVIFKDPEGFQRPAATTREVAGRRLVLQDEAWVEEGVDRTSAVRVVHAGSAEAADLVELHPELAALFELDAAVVVRIDGEVVELR